MWLEADRKKPSMLVDSCGGCDMAATVVILLVGVEDDVDSNSQQTMPRIVPDLFVLGFSLSLIPPR